MSHWVFSHFSPASQKQSKAGRVSKPCLFVFSLFLYVFLFDPPCIVTCSPQNRARWSPPWSFSAWWLSWESRQSFGFCTRSIILALASSRRSSTTLRSGSRTRTRRTWWRPRRPTACRRRALFHKQKHHQALNLFAWGFDVKTTLLLTQLHFWVNTSQCRIT